MLMKATDVTAVCPYAGLRSFTEEESLYFKGRDVQTDQITALLEQNKFLMVTGASGEGKSSLIYGGLIPNARAGFFKARYSNWIIADFRPERNPVRNMALALAEPLNSSPATVETELRRGYSSLIDLYTNSEYYLGEEDENWNRLPDTEKKDKKRKAANLMILVDQFEEFFTNPENFYNEATSKDSQIVVNLVLETARISIRKNLPVYVVCTMRSDYIGQCSAFRGLPEYIGFSQFFVPRLKRKDLKQVIEEPALLNGNRISQRLIERLVFDIADGVDQLPILQHALSRIWQAADKGREEMDLLHYAKVGGMPADDLPDEDQKSFADWFGSLPENHRNFYQETGLSRIIDIHANHLYENAWEYYSKQHPEKPVSQRDAKRIIALAFSCLTKIDNSRAVRNRMTLSEITGIINAPEITTTVAGDVLNIFREEGNSFIRPFITDEEETKKLEAGTVLDITHESLIRNWDKLNQWANREYEYYSTFLDFQKQLDRWKKSGMDRGYLLPIGPLTYFENWYKNCKPNKGWIRRYAENQEDQEQSYRQAELTLNDTRKFLKQSARKEMVTRAFMKYGSKKIATILAIMIMLGLTGFYWYDAEQKKNTRVIDLVRTESMELLNSPEVNIRDKAFYLLAEERYNPGSLVPYLEKRAYKDRLTIANEIYKQLLHIDKQHETSLKNSLESLITVNLLNPDPVAAPELLLNERNEFLILLAMDEYYNPNPKKVETLGLLAEKNYALALRYFRDKSLYRPVIPIQLNVAIQYWLTLGKATPEKIKEMLNAISPVSGKDAEAAFNVYYPKGSFEPNGRLPNDFNGGVHSLASLYAAIGDTAGITWCFNKLLDNNQRNYFELPRVLNNHINIIGYLYQFGHREKIPGLIQWLGAHTTDNPPATLYRNAVIRSGYITHLYTINIDLDYYRSTRGYMFPNLYFCDRSVFDAMAEDYENAVRQMKDPSERNFLLAMNAKRKAMFYHKYWFDRKMPIDESRLNRWLSEAVDLYAQVDTGYLEGKQSSTLIYNGDGVRTSDIKRRELFIYPDYRDGWFAWAYHSDYFFRYLQKNRLLPVYYKTASDLQALNFWVAKAFEWKVDQSPEVYSNNFSLSDSTLNAIIDFADHHPEGRDFDRNLLRIVLSNRAFERNDTLEALKQYRLLDSKNIRRSSDRFEYLEKTFFLNMLNQLAVNLAANGKMKEAMAIAGKFEGDREKALSYFCISENLYRQNADPSTFTYLDTAYAYTKKIDYSELNANVDPRYNQIRLLSEIGSKEINEQAGELLRDIPENGKFTGILYRVSGVSHEGNYYRALHSIPSTLTESQDLQSRNMILLEACKAKEKQTGDRSWRNMDDYIFWTWNYNDYLPN